MQRIETDAGNLGVLEFIHLPFEVRRIYWLYDTPEGTERGLHAHRTLEQFFICTAGKIEVELDNGVSKTNVILDDKSEGLYVAPGQWRIIRNISPLSILLVLASEKYDPDDYIHEYDEFLDWVKTR